MRLNLLLRLVFLLAITASGFAQEKSFYLKDGDRVVFYGDSITDQRLYTTFTETYVVTRFPKLEVSFVHSGWSGDRVNGGGGGPVDQRLERDVFAYNPTVLTIMLGMNDGSYRAFDEGIFDRFRKGYEHIIDSAKSKVPDIRLTLIQPSPFDDVTQSPRFEGGYNAVLVRYGEFIRDLAEREHCNVADLNGPIVAALEKAKATDPELAKKIIPDRVHPGAPGHLLMAAELLKSWNAPRLVTEVEIDAPAKRLVMFKSAKVSKLEGTNGLSWIETDEALPMPVDMAEPVMALAVNASDFVQTLNQQPLRVTGLTSTRYKLAVDGATVGEFSREQLAAGVNLATFPTPMAKQAADVHRLTLDHNNLHFLRWRDIQTRLSRFKADRVQSAVTELAAALDEEEAGVIQRQRAAAQPVEHRYELTPASDPQNGDSSQSTP